MPKLTEELIRKRAEHNEGVLPDLEEVALHQQELEKIENLEGCCRHLKILLLQNNLIPKMEGLNKLRELEYLNLALNNVQKIEGIDNCESLRKLDLTVNFIDVEDMEESIYNLKANVQLEDLYFTGNPICDFEGYRPYVVANLPQLKQLDGKLILPTERIQAYQKLPALAEKLEVAAEQSLLKKGKEKAAGIKPDPNAHSIENRNELYLELAAQKEAKEKQEKKRMGLEPKEPKVIPDVYNVRGEIRQCNEGKYDFRMDDTTDPNVIVLDIGIPRYMDTHSLDVDVNPQYVRCVIKEKLLQLKLPQEVNSDRSSVQRSKTTGWLKIAMPVADQRPERERHEKEPEIVPLKPTPDPGKPYPANAKRNQKPLVGAVSGLKDIYHDPKKVSKKSTPQEFMKEVQTTRTKPAAANDDEDDDEVPPLDSKPK